MAIPSPNHTQDLRDACVDGDLGHLRGLLQVPDVSAEALLYVDNPKRGSPRQMINLHNLIETAAKSDHSPLVTHLFEFAREHSVPIEELVTRETMFAALSTQKPHVVAVLIEIDPSCVNMSLGYSGNPLQQAINGPFRSHLEDTTPEVRIPLVKLLLEKGADPNAEICGFFKPGCHIYTAIYRHKPLDMIRLMLEQGAQTKGTGAFVAAAERGRVDVMELLLACGANLKEQRSETIKIGLDREKTKQLCLERPIDAARREGMEEAVRWLQSHGEE